MRTGPKKSLGQNFLRDPKILSKIVDFAQIENGNTVVEIGPGEGIMTQIILGRAKRVIAIEKDEVLAELLKVKFAPDIVSDKLRIITQDILDLETINYDLSSKDYVLVGNIPYYITGEIFRKFLENPPDGVQPKSITFVIQKEVAERIMARDKKESVLSISIKAYGTPEYGGIIKAGSFYPAPKVDSAILAVRNISKTKFKDVSEEKFFRILKDGFAHKRKFLLSNLQNYVDKQDPKLLRTRLSTLEIGEKARAEDLTVNQWFGLAENL